PAATSIACLVNPSNPTFTDIEIKELRAAANAFGLNLVILNVSNPSELEPAFTALLRQQAGGVLVSGESLFIRLSDQLVALAARYRIAALYNIREAAAAGGLFSYGWDLNESMGQAGIYVGRILKGEKPADLPVQQVTRIRLVINMKTAKALGLTV